MRVIEKFRRKLSEVATNAEIMDHTVEVTLTPLTVEQAIGTPDRQDFPIQKGKEKVIEARFEDSCGQAFSDELLPHACTVSQLLELDLSVKANQAVVTAAANAILRNLDLCSGTIHCRDEQPKKCAAQLPDFLAQEYPNAKKIGLVGLQPAMAQSLADAGYDLTIFDHDPDNIGKTKFGAVIMDGDEASEYLPKCDLVLATGSTIANGSIDQLIKDTGATPLIFFGISIAGVASMLGLNRYCPYGK